MDVTLSPKRTECPLRDTDCLHVPHLDPVQNEGVGPCSRILRCRAPRSMGCCVPALVLAVGWALLSPSTAVPSPAAPTSRLSGGHAFLTPSAPHLCSSSPTRPLSKQSFPPPCSPCRPGQVPLQKAGGWASRVHPRLLLQVESTSKAGPRAHGGSSSHSLTCPFAGHALSPRVPGTGLGTLDPDKIGSKALSPRTHGDVGE